MPSRNYASPEAGRKVSPGDAADRPGGPASPAPRLDNTSRRRLIRTPRQPTQTTDPHPAGPRRPAQRFLRSPRGDARGWPDSGTRRRRVQSRAAGGRGHEAGRYA